VTQRDHHDPLVGTERLLIDGSNLLYALGRGTGRAAPAATLVGRLRAVVPPGVRIEVVFDGPPDHGLGGTRVASGLSIRYSGRMSADSLLDRLVADAIGTGGTPDEAHRAADAILVVTDDIELGRAIRRRGSRTAGAVWLVRRLGRSVLSAPTTGVRRAPRPPAGTTGDDDDRRRWEPGRGATKKTGNPRRGRPRQQGGGPG
jgi:hypothetical protein